MALPAAPKGLRAPGRRLWRDVLTNYELEQHELALLVEAVRTVDLLEQLDELARDEGLIVFGKTHPAVVEARLQRAVLSRILATLRLPEGESDARPQRRGSSRGAYRQRPNPGHLRVLK